MTVWSWVLTDPNLTLVQHADWTSFREYMVNLGYNERFFSASVFTTFAIMLTLSSLYLTIRPPKKIFIIAIFVGIIAGIFSYPALSHDLFNYIFDAKIFTEYGKNPYLYKALDFPADPTIRFMRWVHRAYPYGPVYLLITFVPSYLGMGIFSLTFFLFKALHVILYILCVRMLSNINSKVATIFALHPLVVVEGLINTHNDFVALTLGLIGVSLLIKKSKSWLTRLLLWSSALVKFSSIPIVILSEKWVTRKLFIASEIEKKLFVEFTAMLGVIVVILYQSYTMEVQSWYFLNILIFIPYFPNLINCFSLFFFGLIISYYPYVVGGEWGQGGDINIKKQIILWFAIGNVAILIPTYLLRNSGNLKKLKFS